MVDAIKLTRVIKPGLELKAKEGCCEEASINSREFYIPCNKLAKYVVGWSARQEGPYRMCEMCADHNTRNRGAVIVGEFSCG